MNWKNALDMQNDALRFVRSSGGKRFVTETGDGYADENDTGPETGKMLHELLENGLRRADSIAVDREVCRLICAALETFEPEQFEREELLAEEAFVSLEEPFIDDGNNRICGFLCQLADQALIVHFFDEPKENDQTTLPIFLCTLGVPFGDSSYEMKLLLFLRVFLRLANQRIAIPSVQHDRPAARRAKRAGIVSSYTTIITLRRAKAKDAHDERSYDYSHRWIVGGHWRRQPYGSRDNPSYRQVWIAPYVKGPKDKELIVRSRRVFEFSR